VINRDAAMVELDEVLDGRKATDLDCASLPAMAESQPR